MLIGKWLQSLEYIVANEIAYWRKNNNAVTSNQYSLGQRIIRRLGQNGRTARRTVVVLFVTWVTVSILIQFGHWLVKIQYHAIYLAHISTLVSHRSDSAIEFFFPLWAIQATILAMTYPIVLGFITLLFQQRGTSEYQLKIYLADSCALLSGLAPFALILLMGLQYLFIKTVVPGVAAWWTMLDLAWFLINSAFTINFLIKTYDFLIPSIREDLVRRFMFNVVWPNEIRTLLREQIFPNAPHTELLSNSSARVHCGALWDNSMRPAVTVELGGSKTFSNVYFLPLRTAVNRWLRRTEVAHKATSTRSTSNTDLYFPIDIDNAYSGTAVVARLQGATPLTRLEILLIRFALRFIDSPTQSIGIDVNNILSEWRDSAIDAAHSHKQQAYTDAVRQLIRFTIAIHEASNYISENGQRVDFSELRGSSILGGPLYIRWSRNLFDIIKAAAELIDDDTVYIRTAAYIPQSMVYARKVINNDAVVEHYLSLGRTCFIHMGIWWVNKLEESGVAQHDACNATHVRPPYQGHYARSLTEFVGAWEGITKYAIRGSDMVNSLEWSEIQKDTLLYRKHVSLTVLMVIDAVAIGDTSGAEAALDVLQKWWNGLSLRFGAQAYIVQGRWRINSDVITTNTQEGAYEQISADLIPGGRSNINEALVGVVLKNMWIDHVCVAGYLLIRWGARCTCDKSLPAKLLKAILGGVDLRNDSSVTEPLNPLRSRIDLFAGILRQGFVESGSGGSYKAHIESVLSESMDIGRQDYIPGRIHHGWGGNDEDIATEAKLLLLMLLDPTQWTIGSELSDFIADIVQRHNETARALKEYIGKCISALQGLGNDWVEFFNCIKGTTGPDGYAEAKASLINALQDFHDRIEEALRGAIVQARIDESHLRDIESWCQEEAFDKVAGSPIVRLFSTVRADNKPKQTRTLILQNLSKAEYVTPLMGQRPANEHEWFVKTFTDHVGWAVTRDILLKMHPNELDGSNSKKYWEVLKTFSKQCIDARLRPILMIENQATPKWLLDWTFGYRREETDIPSDMRFYRDETITNPSYVGNINDVEVFTNPLPPGASIAIPRELLSTVEFGVNENGRMVSAVVREIEGNDKQINIALLWQQEVQLNEELMHYTAKFVYGTKGN